MGFTTDLETPVRESDVIFIAVGTPASDSCAEGGTELVAIIRRIGQPIRLTARCGALIWRRL